MGDSEMAESVQSAFDRGRAADPRRGHYMLIRAHIACYSCMGAGPSTCSRQHVEGIFLFLFSLPCLRSQTHFRALTVRGLSCKGKSTSGDHWEEQWVLCTVHAHVGPTSSFEERT